MRLTVLELAARWGEPPPCSTRSTRGSRTDRPPTSCCCPRRRCTGTSRCRATSTSRGSPSRSTGPTAQRCAAIAAPLARSISSRRSCCARARRSTTRSSRFGPDGAPVFVYRKRHPWFPETWATPARRTAGRRDGRPRVTIAICFDVHFLAEDAARELAAADVLAVPERVGRGAGFAAQLLRHLVATVRPAHRQRELGTGRRPHPGSGRLGHRRTPRGELVARATEAGRIDAEV